MLITLLSWIYQLFIILPFGFTLYTLRKGGPSRQEAGIPALTLVFLLGLALVTTLSALLSLVTNIGWQVHVGFLFVAILLWIYLLRQKKLPRVALSLRPLTLPRKVLLLIGGLAAAAVLVLATTVPENSDTAIYHAQAIHWIETYGAVPGLANLHQRFGYNSNWLVVNALFSLSFLGLQSFHLLPSTLFLVLTIYFFDGLFSLEKDSRSFYNLARALFFIAAFLLLAQEISSPGTDMPATLLIWFVVCEWLRMLQAPQEGVECDGLWLSMVCVFCATIKLSSVPIVLFLLWYLVWMIRNKRGKFLIPLLLAAVLIAGSYVGRNIIVSGHLFYPGFNFAPIHLEWSVPVEQVAREKQVIRAFALLPRKSVDEVRQLSTQEQYRRWFANQLPRHKAMLAFIALSSLAMVAMLTFIRGRTWLKRYQQYWVIPAVLFTGLAFWLLSAPAFRFGYGFILGLIVILGAPLLLAVAKPRPPVYLNALVGLAAVVVLLGALMNFSHPKGLPSRLVMPADYPSWKTETCQFGNFSIDCQSQYDSCWYEPFPCAIQGDQKVFRRGSDFSDGFMYVP